MAPLSAEDHVLGIDVDKSPGVVVAASTLDTNLSDKVATLAAPNKESIEVPTLHLAELNDLKARLPVFVVHTLESWWKKGRNKVPGPIRWVVYGVLLGFASYAILNAVGFTAAGVRIHSLAGMIHSAIGDVAQNSLFAAFQHLGASSTLPQFIGSGVAAASSTFKDLSGKAVILAALSKEFIGIHTQHLLELANLEARLPEPVVKTVKSWWKVWQENVPVPIRWLVYGVLLGLVAYLVLNAVGFTATGVRINSLAAGIQSSIGNVSKGSIFAALQRLGASSTILDFIKSGAVVGLVANALEDMLKR